MKLQSRLLLLVLVRRNGNVYHQENPEQNTCGRRPDQRSVIPTAPTTQWLWFVARLAEGLDNVVFFEGLDNVVNGLASEVRICRKFCCESLTPVFFIGMVAAPRVNHWLF